MSGTPSMRTSGYCERWEECKGAIWIRAGDPDDTVAAYCRTRDGYYVAESVKDKAEMDSLVNVGHTAGCSRKRQRE